MMKCQQCGTPMTQLVIEGRPIEWCPQCGSISTCDGVFCSPTNATIVAKPEFHPGYFGVY